MNRTVSSLLAVLAAAALGVGLLLWLSRESTVTILVRGVEESVAEGTALGEAIERFAFDPPTGDLLDVRGTVLIRGAYPGRILLNGRVALSTTKLAPGDRIEMAAGRSRREATDRVVVRVAGGVPANPQFTLARAPAMEVDKGRVSGRLDLQTMQPSGPWKTPKAVALTFDDGPSSFTRGVLAVLERLEAPATFFVVGQLAQRNPKLVRRALRSGMAVESHSYSHPYRPPFDRRSRRELDEEIGRGAEAISSLGRRPTLFRPPGGRFSERIVEAARGHDQRIVLWSVDPEDWRPGVSAAKIAGRVLRKTRAGSIVLLHDGGGNRAQTVKALPAIVQGIRRKGLELVLVEP